MTLGGGLLGESRAAGGFIPMTIPCDVSTAQFESGLSDHLQVVDRVRVEILDGAGAVDLIVLRETHAEIQDAEDDELAIKAKRSLSDLI